jgi:hypothetical protein
MVYESSPEGLILHIPKHLRKNSNLTSASLLFRNNNFAGTFVGMDDDSRGGEPYTSPTTAITGHSKLSMETNVTVFGNEFVLIEHENANPQDLIGTRLRVEVEFTKGMEEFNRNYYHEFGKLAVLAAEMHLYNKVVLELDEAYINNPNMSEGLIEHVNRFEDSQDKYDSSMDRLGKFGFLNDKNKVANLIGLSV